MLKLKDALPKIRKLKAEDCILWRYTDIPSLIEILTNEYLPLLKVSNFSDQSEGALLKFALDKVKASDFGKDFLYDVYKKSAFVSCWCAHEAELAPMWERFSPRDGVGIKTDAKCLLECLGADGFDIGYVKYLDENPDNVFSEFAKIDFEEFQRLKQNLFFYKLDDFKDEREVRILECKALASVDMVLTSDGTNNDRVKELMDNNTIQKTPIFPVYAPMNNLIKEIVISPSARDGIYKIVKGLVESLNKLRKNEGKPEFTFEVTESRRKKWF